MAAYLTFFNSYIESGIQLLIGYFFFINCLQKKGKFFYEMLSAVSGCALILLLPIGSVVQYLVYALFLMVIGILIYHVDWKSVLFYAALAVEIMELCLGIVNSLAGILYPRIAPLHQNAAAVISALLGIVAFLLAAVCYCAVYRYFVRDEIMEKQYLFMVLIPILLLFFMDEYINLILYGNTAVRNAGGMISVNHYQMLFIQLFGMASLFCILFAYKKLLQNFHLSTKLSLLEQEEHFLNQYVEEARARYEQTKSFRHDIKNHITVVKDLLENGKQEEALTYIGDLAEGTAALSFPCSTNNPVVDILLGNKLGMAESMGIKVECSLLLPYPCPVRDIDFGIILSNALDNAIHACQEVDDGSEKYIRVSGRMQGDFILLEVENCFRGKKSARRGTGLSNIKAVAETYQGAMSMKTQDTSFLLSVLLVIPRHTESIPRQNG